MKRILLPLFVGLLSFAALVEAGCCPKRSRRMCQTSCETPCATVPANCEPVAPKCCKTIMVPKTVEVPETVYVDAIRHETPVAPIVTYTCPPDCKEVR